MIITKQVFCGRIKRLNFKTTDQLSIEEALQYAKKQVETEAYRECAIGEVYVNGKLVMTNVHPK